jgi:hypothetical protein
MVQHLRLGLLACAFLDELEQIDSSNAVEFLSFEI